jgi:heptaprenylglyceryl phosphate synthase
LLFNFALKYATRKLEENQKGLEENGTRHFLHYAVDANLVGGNTNTTKKNTETLVNTTRTRGVALEVSRDRS